MNGSINACSDGEGDKSRAEEYTQYRGVRTGTSLEHRRETMGRKTEVKKLVDSAVKGPLGTGSICSLVNQS